MTTITNTSDVFRFTYDSARPYNENFTDWRLKNSAERSAYSEKQLTNSTNLPSYGSDHSRVPIRASSENESRLRIPYENH